MYIYNSYPFGLMVNSHSSAITTWHDHGTGLDEVVRKIHALHDFDPSAGDGFVFPNSMVFARRKWGSKSQAEGEMRNMSCRACR